MHIFTVLILIKKGRKTILESLGWLDHVAPIQMMLNISDSLHVQASVALDPVRGSSSRRRRGDLEKLINLSLPKCKKL